MRSLGERLEGLWAAVVVIAALSVFAVHDARAQTWQETMQQAINAHQMGHLERAEDRLRAALQRAKAFEAPDRRLAETHLGLASVLADLEQVVEARQHLDHARTILSQIYGEESLPVATVINAKAVLDMREQLFEEAIPSLRKVIAILERERGGDHIDLAPILDGLAAAQLGVADYDASAAAAGRALAIREAVLGESDPDLVANLQAQAAALRLGGKLAEAEAADARANAIQQGMNGQ